MTITCPVDGITIIEEWESPCHQCGADLREYWRVKELSHVIYNHGLRCVHEHHPDEAIGIFRMLVAFDTDSPLPAIVLGKLLARKNRIPEAIEVWEQGRAAFPDQPDLPALIREAESRMPPADLPKAHFSPFPPGTLPGSISHDSSLLLPIGGLVLLAAPLSYGLIAGLHYADPQGIRTILTLAGIGAPLVLLGMTMPARDDTADLLSVSGSLLSFGAVALFFAGYGEGWYYPQAGYMLLLYFLGLILFAGAVLRGLLGRTASSGAP